jgi:integrase
MRTKGRCATCTHVGVLPGVSPDGPTCRTCSGIRLNVDCVRCGQEDELYSGGRCWRCTLSDLVDETLTDTSTGRISPALEQFASALKGMKRANSGLTWLRQPHVQEFFRAWVAGPTSHEALDQLSASRTREYVRGLLVEHGALPRRDEYLAVFTEWVSEAPRRLHRATDRGVLLRYIHWSHLSKMRRAGQVDRGTFLRRKQATTVAVEFLNWLADRDLELGDATQGDIEEWATGGSTTRLIAADFLNWARRVRLANTDLRMPRHRRGTAARMSLTEQREASANLTDPEVMSSRDRVAGVLVLVFGQQIEDVVRLTWKDVDLRTGQVSILLSGVPLPVPEPFDEAWRTLRQETLAPNTAAHPTTDWVFPGTKPGQPVNPDHLAQRLRQHLQVRAARLGTLNELTKLAPVTIAAEALGYSPHTLELHAKDSGATYAQYIQTLKTMAGGASSAAS